MNLQTSCELRKTKAELKKDLDKITPRVAKSSCVGIGSSSTAALQKTDPAESFGGAGRNRTGA